MYKCTCNCGWTGTNCDSRIDFCSNNDVCLNGGICQNKGCGTSYLIFKNNFIAAFFFIIKKQTFEIIFKMHMSNNVYWFEMRNQNKLLLVYTMQKRSYMHRYSIWLCVLLCGRLYWSDVFYSSKCKNWVSFSDKKKTLPNLFLHFFLIHI